MQLTRTTKYIMVTTTYKHTVDATEIVECRCLVILAWMCLSIQLSLNLFNNFLVAQF